MRDPGVRAALCACAGILMLLGIVFVAEGNTVGAVAEFALVTVVFIAGTTGARWGRW